MRIVIATGPRPAAVRRTRSNRRRIPDRPRGRRLSLALLAILIALAATFGAVTGYFLRTDMPTLRGLEEYAPAEMTRILARDGAEIANYATEKRILLDYGEIPESFRHALIASEDSRFYQHGGIDPIGGLRALWASIRRARVAQGASTLTMQLAGNLFLDRSQRTLRRKLQESVLALQIERRFSKEEIVRMYCNQVHFGHGLHGLEAAARYYFGKSAWELDVNESATLVGLLPRPASYSPYRNLKRATERRDLVLGRMVHERFLDPADARRIAAEPITVSRQVPGQSDPDHFNEEVRRWLQKTYGSADLYGGGLVVETTLDQRLQRIARDAVEMGLRELDRRQGWRKGSVRRVPDGEDPAVWESNAWSHGIVRGHVTDGVVLRVDGERADVRVDRMAGVLGRDAVAWTGKTRPDQLLRVGDVIRVRVLDRADNGELQLTLEQEPEAEAALVALDPSTGEIKALIGGFDFSRSEYDRATQARRQTGSLFKPFVYAAALSHGRTLADTLVDEPTVFLDRRNPVPYQPENFSRKYYGTISLRTALERSINIATVKLLREIGYDAVLDTARALGVRSRLRPFPSLALGAFEMTLLEVTAAYGAFANQGLHIEPHTILRVTDRNGQLIHDAEPRVTEAVSPQIAYLMSDVMSGVIRRGTGKSAGRVLGQTLAGKTGTTDNYSDAWFVGYSPDLVVGVWVGFDEPRSLGEYETGARAALPIWTEFMRRALPSGDRPFPVPPGITRVAIDPRTGKRPDDRAGCAARVVEVFAEGTEPAGFCSLAEHDRLALPYPFHRYPVDADGALAIPFNELVRLLEREPGLHLKRRRGLLVAEIEGQVVRVPLNVLPDRAPPELPELEDGADAASWIGTDGRPATVVFFDDRSDTDLVSRRR